jgi:hypothetical protein
MGGTGNQMVSLDNNQFGVTTRTSFTPRWSSWSQLGEMQECRDQSLSSAPRGGARPAYWALAVALEVSPDQSNDRGAFPATCHRDRLVPPCAWDDGVVGLLQADSNSTTLMSGSFIV